MEAHVCCLRTLIARVDHDFAAPKVVLGDAPSPSSLSAASNHPAPLPFSGATYARGFDANILKIGTPPLMTIGRRCRELGYNLIWLGSSGLDPYWVTPSGEVVPMEVIGLLFVLCS